jgi:flagellum-specific peptidoglycan hydrolase FlgJ
VNKLLQLARTIVQPSQVYLSLRDAWQAQLGESPERASLLVLLSQWSLETANGARCMNFNLGGIKHVDGDGCDYCEFLTVEYKNGQPIRMMLPFRAYPSLEAGAADYLELIRKRFALAWPAVVTGQTADFAHLLKLQGYYTAPEQDYAAGLARCYRALDAAVPPDTKPELPADRSESLNKEASAVGEESPEPPAAA